MSTNLGNFAIHHQNIHESLRGVLKGKRQAADNFETEARPQFNGALVGADDEVELHRAEAAFPGSLERMEAHLAGDAAALRGGRGDVAAIGHVRPSTQLVRFQEIGPQHLAVFLPHESFFIRGEPVFERLLFAHVARKGVGLPKPNHWLENRPNCIMIAIRGEMDGQATVLISGR